MSKPHSVRTIGRSGFWSVANQLLGQLLSLLVFLITARFVSKEAFGIMATCMIGVEFFRQFLMESIATTIYARKAPSDDDYTAGFYIILISGIFSALVLFFLAGPIADTFGHGEIAPTLNWIAVILLTMGLSKMHEIWLTKQLLFKTLALRSFCSIMLGGGVGIWMATHGYGLASLIAQQIVTNVTSLIWLWSASPWRPSLRPHRDNVMSVLHYWKYLAFNSISAQINLQTDTIFASYYLGPAATGVYNAAKRLLAAASMVLSGGFNSVALPALASISHDDEQLKKSFLTCVMIVTLITAPLYAGLAALSHDIVYILMGAKWSDVPNILSILCLSAFINSINPYCANILLIKNKPNWQSVIGFANAIFTVAFMFAFVKYGLAAMAVVLFVRVLINWIVFTVLALRLLALPVRDYIAQIFYPIFFASLMAGAIILARAHFDFHPALNLLLYIPLGAVLYLALFFIFDKNRLLFTIDLFRQTLAKKHEA